MSGSDTAKQRDSPLPSLNGDSSIVAADAFDGDLLSAIASSVAQGEASRRTAAVPLLPNGSADGVASSAQAAAFTSYTAHTDRHTSQNTVTYATHSGIVSTGRFEQSTMLAADQQSDRLETSSTTLHIEQKMTGLNGQYTMPSQEPYYAPMSDSEPEDAAPIPLLNGSNGTGLEAVVDMLRSPSVSYVDPDVDLEMEQDRGHMKEYGLPELNGSATPMAGIDYDLQPDQTKQKSRSISFPVPETRNNRPSTSNGDVLQDAFIPISSEQLHIAREKTPPPSAEEGKGRVEASTPVDQGWGISGQHTPSRAATYDEVDELDELASAHGNTPRLPENQFKVPSLSGTSAGMHANAAEGASPKGKGKERAIDDEDTLADSSYSASTARTEDAPLYFKNDDELSPSSPLRTKGKERASDPESEIPNPNARIPRLAKPGRRYRELRRLKQAACLTLHRDMEFLDISLVDEEMTCWIRCVHWEIPSEVHTAADGNDAANHVEGSGNDENTPDIDNRPDTSTEKIAHWTSAVPGRRSSQSPKKDAQSLDEASSAKTQNSNTSKSKITCQAEMLSELVDGNKENDKWRVIRVNKLHSGSCERSTKQTKANEIVKKAQIGMQAEDIPGLAENIFAATYQDQGVKRLAEEPIDRDLSLAIQESLDTARKRQARHEALINAEDLQQDLPNGEHEDEAPVAGPSGTTLRELDTDQDNLPTSDSTTTPQRSGRTSTRNPGLLRRFYETFSARNTLFPQPGISDTFKTKDELIDAATAALSLTRTHIFARYGERYEDGAPFIDVFCPCHEYLTTNERNTIKNIAGHSYDCSARVKAYFKEGVNAWIKSSVQVQHSPNCPAINLAAVALVAETVRNKTNGHFQAASNTNSRENSVSSNQSQEPPVLQKLMTFHNSVDFRQAASRALGRSFSQLDIKESQHPVFSKQSVCNAYCQNYAFGQSQTTARGWSSLIPGIGLGGGNQPAKCMAFVEASKKSDDQPWRIASFKLEHGARCQSDYEQALAAPFTSRSKESQSAQNGEAARRPPQPIVNAERAALIAQSANTSSSHSGTAPVAQSVDKIRAAYAARGVAASSGSRSSSNTSVPLFQNTLQPAPPIVAGADQGVDSLASGGDDSHIEFAGEHEAPPAPEIPIGGVYKPNDLAKLAQKLSTFVNKGSEVVWTQKPGNVPRALACKYGPGFKQDTSAGFACTFRVTAKFNQGNLQVESYFDRHSPACLVKHGNRSVATNFVKSERLPRSSLGRKTGSTVPVTQAAIHDSGDNEMIQSQCTGHQLSPIDMLDLFPADNMHENRQEESNHAAGRRAAEVASVPSRQRPEKRKRVEASPRAGRDKYSKVPPKPQEGRVYNSVHHFINDAKSYSEAKSPAADLRRSDVKGGKVKGQKRRPNCVVLECSFPDCPFRVAGRTMQDNQGRELEGFQVLPSVAKHSRECRNTERTKRKPRTSTSKSASVVEIESSVQPEDSGEDTPGKGKKRKSRQSNASQASQGGKRRRIEDSDESSASLPPPLSTLRKSPSKRRKSPSPPSSVAPVPDMPMEAALPGLRSPTHSSRGGTPAPLAATSRTNDATDDDMEAFFAPYRRNFVKDEPQSPGRPPGHIKLYTGQTFDSRDEFVNAVLQHTEQRNPGCRLSVANTDPARVRVYCMRADCAYSFNSVYEHGARRIPAVKVTANHRDHSASCLSYYQRVGQSEQRVHFDPPMVDQEIGDWHDFESAVQAHTDSVNPGCELKTTKGPEHLRVYCPHKDLGCKYSFRAKFDIAEIQEGRVKVTNVRLFLYHEMAALAKFLPQARTEHSDGCLEHHKRIAEEEAEEEEALNPGVATKRSKPSSSNSQANLIPAPSEQPQLGPGPHPGDHFDNETAFRIAVEAHSQLVNPGSSLSLRRVKNNLNLQCRNFHTGCRYEFYAAYHPPAEDGTRRVTVTDIVPDHHEMCVAELVLQGRRPAPDGESPVRTRRGRASLAGLAGLGSQNSQAGSSVNDSTKIVARKSTQAFKPPPRSRMQDSDTDSDRLSLRESNLMSHTSMHSLDASTRPNGPVRSARPPLIPPSQRVNGRPPLVPPVNEPTKPLKRTRFEDIAASSTDSSQVPIPSASQPTQISASSTETGATAPTASGTASASLVQVMQDHPQAAALLASIGYHTIADLKRIGVSVEDWQDLFEFLAGCDPESFRVVSETADGQLDPLEKFLLQRRARLAFNDEAHGQFRRL